MKLALPFGNVWPKFNGENFPINAASVSPEMRRFYLRLFLRF